MTAQVMMIFDMRSDRLDREPGPGGELLERRGQHVNELVDLVLGDDHRRTDHEMVALKPAAGPARIDDQAFGIGEFDQFRMRIERPGQRLHGVAVGRQFEGEQQALPPAHRR